MKDSGERSSTDVLVLCDGSPSCRALVRLLHSLEFDVVTVDRDAFQKRFSPTPKRLSMVDVVVIDLDGSAELFTFCDALMSLSERPAILLMASGTLSQIHGISASADRVNVLARPFSGRTLHTEIKSLLAA